MSLLNFLQAASNAVAGNVTGPVDLLALGLRKAGVPVGDAPIGGSEWARRVGLLGEVTPGASQVAGETMGLLGPVAVAAKAPQVARGLLQVGQNAAAPRTINAGLSSKERGVVVASLSKQGDPKLAAINIDDAMRANGGAMPYGDIGKMTRDEFDKFYERLAPHHQGKFDRLLRAHMTPMYDDLPATIKQYGRDFAYENPALVRQLQGVRPDSKVKVFRSVSAKDPDAAIMPGDWIALQRNYAKMHGHLGNDAARLLTSTVPARDIRWAGTSADEYFYVPSSGVNDAVQSKYDALLHSLGLLQR